MAVMGEVDLLDVGEPSGDVGPWAAVTGSATPRVVAAAASECRG